MYSNEGLMRTLGAGHGMSQPMSIEVISGIGEKNFGKQYREGNRIYDGDKIATALKASNVGNAGGETNLYSVAVGAAERIRNSGPQIEVNNEEISNALTSNMSHSMAAIDVQHVETSCNQGIFVQVSEDLTVYAVWYPKKQCYIAIRKLTPKECFRLQGWTDDYFEKAEFVNSNSQLYKQAGNGVTVSVIEAIARKMK